MTDRPTVAALAQAERDAYIVYERAEDAYVRILLGLGGAPDPDAQQPHLDIDGSPEAQAARSAWETARARWRCALDALMVRTGSAWAVDPPGLDGCIPPEELSS